MTNIDFDNIPLLDDLITKGEQAEQNIVDSDLKLKNKSISGSRADLEVKIHDILQRHTSQATAEILAIIDASSEIND